MRSVILLHERQNHFQQMTFVPSRDIVSMIGKPRRTEKLWSHTDEFMLIVKTRLLDLDETVTMLSVCIRSDHW